MKQRFTEIQIIKALQMQEKGVKVADICREHGICQATFFKWKSKYGGLEISEIKRLRSLEEENKQLKRLVADLSLDKVILQDALSKNW
jgi:putative transposase